MGYNLTIGEAVLVYDREDLYLRISAEGATHPDAPDHDPFTGKGNGRSPSYTAWHEFCKDAGPDVFKLFYGGGWDRSRPGYRPCPEDFHRETPLLNEHPGAQPLCQGDLDVVRAARIKREATNGGQPPGFHEESGADNGTDPTLARLLWLEFWIDWALKNCRIPILKNT